MKKLTKQIRHEIYVKALEVYDYGYGSICISISDALKDLGWDYPSPGDEDCLEFYPEIYKHKPAGKQTNELWYPTTEHAQRINILKQAIKETE